MNEFFTVEMLCTYGGMVAFVTSVTQIAKYYVKVSPKWIALITALIGQASVQIIFTNDFSMQGIIMALFNVVAVLIGAVGAFETVVKPVQRKLEGNLNK